MVAAAAKKKRSVVSLREDVARSKAAHRVDREKRVIFGVKVVGLESANRRRYTLECLRKALPLYEGATVYIDHPKKPGDARSFSDDFFGRLVNARLENDGVYADLEYLKADRESEKVCEAAERMPEKFGMSHNAQGEGANDRDGYFVVEHIAELRSVDVVCEPATTNGLFEGKQPMKIKAYFEQVINKRADLKARLEAKLKPFLEDAYMASDMPDDAAPVEDDPMAALANGFKAAIAAVIDDESMDASAKSKKISDLLKTHEKLSAKDDEEGNDEQATEGEEVDGEGADDDKKKKDSQESRLQRLEKLERKEQARELCEEAGLAADKDLLELLVEQTSEAAMKKLVAREKKAAKPGKVRSGNTGGKGGDGNSLLESKGVPTSEAGQMAFLRGV